MQHLLHSSIPAEHLDYLAQAGFTFHKNTRWSGTFRRENVAITIEHLVIKVTTYNEGNRQFVVRYHEFNEIDKLDFISWVMLMHITGAVHVREMLSAVSDKEIGNMFHQITRSAVRPGPGSEAPTLAFNEIF